MLALELWDAVPGARADRFERPRSERQADAGRGAARLPDGAGARLPAAVVSRLRDADRHGDLARHCTASATIAPDVMQLLYVANRYEKRAPIERVARRRRDRRLRPLPGVERSPTARRRASIRAWLTEIQRFLPPPDLTILLDIAPETAGGRKAAGRDSLRARSRAAGARARELPPPGRRAGVGPPRRRSAPKAEVHRRRHSRGRDATRAAVTARTSRAPASRSTRAHASSVAPVVLTSSTSTTQQSAHVRTPRRSANASRTLAWRRAAGRSVCAASCGGAASARTTGGRGAAPVPRPD